MQVHTFIAESAADAVAQIRAQLGPQAVVLNVRPLPGEGLARLWQKKRIEVLACLPEPASTVPEPADALSEVRQELAAIRQRVEGAQLKPERPIDGFGPPLGLEQPLLQNDRLSAEASSRAARTPNGSWRVGAFLESGGLLPVHAQRFVEQLRTLHGDAPPVSLGQELQLAGALFRGIWAKSQPASHQEAPAHVLIGAPGVGKTVCLCKWLTQSILVQGRSASVWRLDGRTANTAEALSVYSEILGAPVERSIPAERGLSSDLLLIDLPGVNCYDASALAQLNQQIEALPQPQVHLVLNAAYETSLLLAQVRAFSALPVTDLIFTHLDEEGRWGKLWNFVLGTNFSVRFLSAGQNIPGEWLPATPESILSRQFPGK